MQNQTKNSVNIAERTSHTGVEAPCRKTRKKAVALRLSSDIITTLKQLAEKENKTQTCIIEEAIRLAANVTLLNTKRASEVLGASTSQSRSEDSHGALSSTTESQVNELSLSQPPPAKPEACKL